MSKGDPRIIVVGAGIIGASLAWHLTSRGASVTILEADAPGGMATPNSFSWINSNYSFSESYFRLRHHSMLDWRRLADAVQGLPVSLTGSVYLPAKGIDLPEFVSRNAAWGYRIELIDAKRVRELEPNLVLDVEVAAHAQDEGAAEPVEVARLLVDAAVARGAVLRAGLRVDGLDVSDNRVAGVVADGERIEADEVVVAAGAATPMLVAGLSCALPLSTPPGLLAHTKPVSRVLNGLVLADGLHLRQKVNGQLLAGSDFQGSELSEDPERGGEELVRRIRKALKCDEPLVLKRTTTGLRPMPEDGLPIVGRLPDVAGVYVAVTHSGVTLCPAVGDLAAREIIDGERDSLLGPFGPERFSGEAQSAAHA